MDMFAELIYKLLGSESWLMGLSGAYWLWDMCTELICLLIGSGYSLMGLMGSIYQADAP